MRYLLDLLTWLAAAGPVLLSADRLPTAPAVSAGLLLGATLVARRWPVVAAAVPLVLGVLVTGQAYVEGLTAAVVVFSFLLGRRTGGRSAGIQVGALLGVAVVALVLAPGSLTGDDWFTAASTLLLNVVVPWTVGQYLRHQAELVAAGFDLAARLEREHARASGRERLRERARIASDMHDSLGHDLSLLAVRAAALQVSPDAAPDLRQGVAELRESAAAATSRLRQILGMLREEGEVAPVEPAAGSLVALVGRAAASGVDVRLDGDDLGTDLPEPTARAAARVVQEGLTNATRHAPGSAVRVTVRRTADELRVRVANGAGVPGARPAAVGQGSGYGLVGLDERVRLAGGTLSAGPADGGYELVARLPVVPAVAPPPSPAATPGLALAEARRRLRRGLLATFWAPVVIGLALVAVYLLGGGRL